MPRHVAVVFVHGILNQDLNFAEPMRRRLLEHLPKDFHNYVHFEAVQWADKVRGQQRSFMQRAQANAGIVDNKLRWALIEGLGDAAAYQKTRHPDNSSYYSIQGCISEVLDDLDKFPVKDRPLIFIGHSLGCHIISSYVWDLNKLKQRTEDDIKAESDPWIKSQWDKLKQASEFRRLGTFAGFVTLGSNMPLFTFTFGQAGVQPITSPPGPPNLGLKAAFPGSALPTPLLKQARWLNFFSKRDLLGFPLKPLYTAFDVGDRLHDISVRSESWRSRTVPYLSFLKAHIGYWTNPTVLLETSKLIREVVETPEASV